MSAITIATSIAPRNFELQRAAVDSWLKLGFSVISLNSATEASLVAENFPDILLKIVPRSAESVAGRPYVFFDDVCKALAESGSSVCGIINSDIQMRASQDFKEIISREASGSFVFGSRIDVKDPEAFAGERYLVGFDFFFFDRKIITCYPSSEFCLGAPWWDYWAPMVPLLKGVPCKEIVTPLAFHVWHETKWNPELFSRFGRDLATGLRNLVTSGAINADLTTGISQVLATKEFIQFSLVILRHIWDGANQFDLYSDLNDRVEISLTEYVSYRRQLFERSTDCVRYARDVESLRAELAKLKTTKTAVDEAVQEMQDSFSWRITRPLRWLGDRLRGRRS